MLGPKYMQGCLFAFVILTVLSQILEGAFMGEEAETVISQATRWSIGHSGWHAIPMVAISVLVSLPKMLLWDYGVFRSLGNGGMFIQLLLGATVSFGIVWGFFATVMPIMVNAMMRGVSGIFRGLGF